MYLGGIDLDARQQVCGLLPAVRLDHGGDDVGAALQPAMCLAEHGERLADAGRRTEVDAQLAPLHRPIIHRPPRTFVRRAEVARTSREYVLEVLARRYMLIIHRCVSS